LAESDADKHAYPTGKHHQRASELRQFEDAVKNPRQKQKRTGDGKSVLFGCGIGVAHPLRGSVLRLDGRLAAAPEQEKNM